MIKLHNLSVLFTLTLLLSSMVVHAEEDSVKILSISPTNAKPLIAGSTVAITAEVEYTLVSANTASITMVIQRAESGHRPLANEFDVALKGTGKMKITTEVEIPNTKAIQVFIPLTPEGNQSTTIVDSRMYKVVSE